MKNVVISTHDECHAAVFHFAEVANKVQKELTFGRRLLSEEQRGRFSAEKLCARDIYQAACQLKEEFKIPVDHVFLLVVDGNLFDEVDDEYLFVTSSDQASPGEPPSRVVIISLFFLNPKSSFMKDAGEWWTSLGKAEQAKKKSDCVMVLLLSAVTAEIMYVACHPATRGCVMDYCQTPAEIVQAATGEFRFCPEECVPTLSQIPEGQALLAIAKGLTDSPLPVHVFEPELPAQSLAGGPVVISIHGIRTRGAWQKALTLELNNAGFKHEPLDYGFFRAVKLLIPSIRARQVKWFVDQYAAVRQGAGQKVSVIAHSFGTYIVAGALEKYAEVKLDAVILCGSIVRRDFPWSEMIPNRLRRVLNDYGRLDMVVKLAGWAIEDAGSSGSDGFIDNASERVQQRCRPQFRHSDYFYALNYRETWIPFLKGQAIKAESGGRPRLRNWKFLLTRAAALLALVVLGWTLWHRLR